MGAKRRAKRQKPRTVATSGMSIHVPQSPKFPKHDTSIGGAIARMNPMRSAPKPIQKKRSGKKRRK